MRASLKIFYRNPLGTSIDTLQVPYEDFLLVAYKKLPSVVYSLPLCHL